MGGQDKGGDYDELARLIARRGSRVRGVVAIGENRKKIISALKKFLTVDRGEAFIGAVKNLAKNKAK